MLLARALRRFIGDGRLTIIDSRDRRHVVDGATPYPACTIRLHDRKLEWQLLFNAEQCVGEAYVDGRLTIEEGTLRDFFDLCNRNILAWSRDRGGWLALIEGVRTRLELRRLYNPLGVARTKVSHHYDLTSELFNLFLDSDRQYSCAYFRTDNDDLEQAQRQKKDHILAKLHLEPGHKVFDIGSGWGGLGLDIQRLTGAEVTGVTLSHEQHAYSTKRAEQAGVADKVQFKLQDYREESGTYDRIVSVGMFEHVGPRHYDEFFGKLRDLLADDGVALLHSIGRFTPPTPINPWIERYIFPGAYTPAMSEVAAAIENAGLLLLDTEILRVHYADTLKRWDERFQANRDKARELYDERFCRMWEFYLQGCEYAFRSGPLMVFQALIGKRRDAVPLTRDYMYEREREFARRSGESAANRKQSAA